MDGALSSSRYDGGGGGGGGRHDEDRHYHRGGGRRYRGGGGGHGYHGRRNHPYGGGGGRRNRGPRPPGNRFSGSQTKSVDPQTAMMQQLAAMVSRVGEVKVEEYANQGEDNDSMRPAVAAVAKNITDLCAVLCSESNAGLFLKYEEPQSLEGASVDAKQEAGYLAHLVVSCVSALPLETPTYAGLTLAVNEKAPPSYAGFAARCVTYAMRMLSRDLDLLLLKSNAEKGVVVTRIQHLLRYLALLGNLNIVLGYSEEDDKSVAGLLQSLVTAAVQAATLQNQDVACALAHMVLSTIPYTLGYLPSQFVAEQLLEPLETSVLNSSVYTSTFWPGLGKSALLLKQEQTEGEEDEDEEEDEEEDGSDAGQRCDTLQDLHRAVKTMLQEQETTKFALLSDAPWKGLKSEPTAEATMTDESTEQAEKASSTTQETMVYTGDPLRLELSQDCQSIPYLLNVSSNKDTKLQFFGLEDIVFGRLPIFGAPAQDDEEEEDEEEGMEAAPPNEQLQSYQKNFGLLDRFFLADAIRDCLLNHKSTVSDSGLERGSAKDTAQQVWAVSQVFAGGKEGIEYGIIETIFSLLLQSSPGSIKHIYLSRVLLELTRLQPSTMPQALVAAVSNLVEDYLPSLVPSARDSLSAWFAMHLTNTDYQWPAGYWELWTPHVLTSDGRNSRGEFVVRALEIMASSASSVVTLYKNCLPAGSVLGEYLLGMEAQSLENSYNVSSIQNDLEARLWDQNEDPDTARAYMVGDELTETHAGENDSDEKWWRTRLVTRALLRPAKRQRERMQQAIQQAKESQENDAMVVDEQDDSSEVLTDLTDVLVRYRPVLLATLVRDCQDYDESQGEPKKDDSEVLLEGEAVLLKQLQDVTCHSRVLMVQCISCLLQNRVVSSLSVLRWALGDFGGAHENKVAQRWWDLAATTLRVGIAAELADSESAMNAGGDINMVIDNTGSDAQSEDASTKHMEKLVEYASPLLQYTVQRVCRLLAVMDKLDSKKAPSPSEVDLIEGMKQLVVGTHALILSESRKRSDGEKHIGDTTESNLYTALSESDISGTKLASICRSGENSSATTELLTQIMEGT